MIYSVYTTESFDNEILKFKINEERIKKIFLQLKENPHVGDQLKYKNLREKRINEKRIYYLVYDDLKSVLLVAVSDKKNQQATINHIIDYFDEYKEYLKKIIKN
jgi:mRNA-degrading endonuclease RelE of RelBE toxin-antitoxin system